MSEPQNSSHDRDWHASSAAHKGARMAKEELEPRIEKLEIRIGALERRFEEEDEQYANFI